jgi:hypothetical protein
LQCHNTYLLIDDFYLSGKVYTVHSDRLVGIDDSFVQIGQPFLEFVKGEKEVGLDGDAHVADVGYA